MNASNITLVAVAVVGALAGVVIGRVVTKNDTSCTESEPRADFVWTFDGVTPKSQNDFFKALSTVGAKPAVFRRDMALVQVDSSGNKTCSVPQQLLNAGGRWCQDPDPCKYQPDMGQQVTQRVGFKSRADLEQALSLLTPTLTPPQ